MITSELEMKSKEVYKVYHRLQKTEHSFRLLKTQLEARPIYVQIVESIYGHFTICYLSLVLLRLLEKIYLNEVISTERLVEYIRKFRVVKNDKNCYLNLMKRSEETKFSED